MYEAHQYYFHLIKNSSTYNIHKDYTITYRIKTPKFEKDASDKPIRDDHP